MTISVIICTYNRARNLEGLLESLRKASPSLHLSWEVIVVDNNSTDDTRSVIEKFAKISEFNTQYIFESRQGVSYAKNRAIQEARGEILAFTDDDCIVDPRWIECIEKEFMVDPCLSILGGRVELYNQADKPVTTRTSRERKSMTAASFDQIFALIPGCNVTCSRAVFDELGGFDPEFGPGAKFRSGDDTDFLYRAYKKKFKMIYSPDVLVYHNHGRRTDAQIQDLNRGYAYSRGAFYGKNILQGDRNILKLAYWETCWLTKDLVKNLVSRKETVDQRILLWGISTGALGYLLSTVRRHYAASRL